jgi:two-component system response regulator NreC
MTAKIRVLLADDHAILRDGVRALLHDEPDMAVVGEADNGRWAVDQARTLRPDVVLMDIGMPLLSGLEATRQIKKENPSTRVLILTMHENAEYIQQVLAAGASGYVLKHAAGKELVNAIRAVAQGGAFFSPTAARTLADLYVNAMETDTQTDPYEELTSREREVLQLVAEGHTNQEIAQLLSLSVKTIKTHRLHLMQKLDLHDRSELVRYAIQKRIINP